MVRMFEHVGMTVGDMDRSLDFYVGKLGLELILRRTNPDGNQVAFLDCGGAMLEVICPATGAGRSVDVAQGASGLRHLTFRFDDVDAAYAELEAAGVEMMEAPRDAHNRDMVRRVAFCRDPDGIAIELIEPVGPRAELALRGA